MRQLFLFFLLISITAYGKKIEVDSFLVKKEQEINAQLIKLRAATSDAMQQLENESLINLLEEMLPYPGVMDYEFSLFESMSTIKSPDGEFRLFNWNTEDLNGNNKHFCYAVIPNRGNKPNEVIEFKEDHVTISHRPEHTLTPNTWYGALYYKIIPTKIGNKTVYTVIGYNGGTRSSNKKILDVFYFKGKKLRLGYPIFQESKESKSLLRRVFFEYSEKVTIAVNMNERLDAIVFDHLVPEAENLKGFYTYYVPDMTYDGYRWNGEYWEYLEDLIAVNGIASKPKQFKPTDSGEAGEFREMEGEWIDPVDSQSPAGSGENAIAPVAPDKSNPSKKGTKKQRKKKGLFKRKSHKPRSAIQN
jgi:hypothetical protein